jgi:hypothetical protein
MILFEKFGQHQPLNRQSERYAREGIDLSVSTLADQVGACATALQPLHALIEAHVLAADSSLRCSGRSLLHRSPLNEAGARVQQLKIIGNGRIIGFAFIGLEQFPTRVRQIST